MLSTSLFARSSLSLSLSIIFLVITTTTMAANTDISTEIPKDVARYDYYRIYRVEFETVEQVELFKKLEEQSDSLQCMGHPREVGQKLSILVSAHKVADFADILATYKVKYNVLSYNFQEKVDRSYSEVSPVGTDVKNFDWAHYFHLETIYEWLEQKVSENPTILTLLDLGNSTQDVPIKGVKLSHNPNNRAIVIEGGIHAREWISPASATYLINELLTSKDEAVQKLAKNYNWFIFPSVNPDGYKYTFEHDRMWRKNRQLFYSTRGVDLNRNYPDHWNSAGSSSDPTRYDYSGPSAGSEIETQCVLNFINENRQKEGITAYISLHSFSQMIMFPHGYTNERVPNYEDLSELGKRATERIKQLTGETYTSGSIYETIYPSSGDSMGWAYGTGVPIAYTFELRGPPDSEDWFLLPADQILPTATEAFGAIQAIIEGATEKGYFDKLKAEFY